MTVQDVMNTEVITVEGKEIIVADSREVAEVMEIRHDSLLRKVEDISKDLVDHKIVVNKIMGIEWTLNCLFNKIVNYIIYSRCIM